MLKLSGFRPFILPITFLALALAPHSGNAEGSEHLIVGPEGDYASITAALDAANDGDTIEVRGGIYPAPLEINKSVTLIGTGNATIDGGGEGSLVEILATDVIFRGFTLRNSGSVMFNEDAAINIRAERVVVEDNVLENVLFGIYFANAGGGIARNNRITGQPHDLGMRGDGIRVWYSNDVQLIGNEVVGLRDTLLWYSNDILIEGNTFRDNRYGLHFMYCVGVLAQHNTLVENSVGSFMMYSDEITFKENQFLYNRGPSGYSVALKDSDTIVVEDNLMIGNIAGIYLDNSPANYDHVNLFRGNYLAYNDVGVSSLPAVERNIFQANSFVKNIQQTEIRGRAITSRNVWHQDGLGNYWSDYTGYDKDGDGVGDLTYQADRLFDSLLTERPVLKLFLFSPATQAIEFTASAFPVFRPDPLLIDEAPMMTGQVPAFAGSGNQGVSFPFLAVALAMAGAAGLGYLSVFTRQDQKPGSASGSAVPRKISQQEGSMHKETDMITVENLTKDFGDNRVLDGLSFTIKAGEAVALWGTNGAGKTTTLRCMLGLLPYEGKITLNGVDVSTQGKAARTFAGYVPQEASFYDLSVEQTMKFYAGLKKVPAGRVPELLERVGLTDHRKKAVAALSGGMKQRLALAVGLLSDPPVLMMDEATANLDTQVRAEFLNLIQTLHEAGKTIIFSTHRLEEVMALADRVLVLKDGKVASSCRPADLPEALGLQQQMRIFVPEGSLQDAVQVMDDGGFRPIMNRHAFYIPVATGTRMMPLRILEDAGIPVEDFDLIDGTLDNGASE